MYFGSKFASLSCILPLIKKTCSGLFSTYRSFAQLSAGLPSTNKKRFGTACPDKRPKTCKNSLCGISSAWHNVAPLYSFDNILVSLSNALKFTPEKGEVIIHLELVKQREAVEVKVIDTGIGIAQNQQAHIFNRFYQADQSLTSTIAGTGIGLSLANELSELHGGSLSVESEQDKGSTFTFILPLIEGEYQRLDAQQSKTKKMPNGSSMVAFKSLSKFSTSIRFY